MGHGAACRNLRGHAPVNGGYPIRGGTPALDNTALDESALHNIQLDNAQLVLEIVVLFE